MSVQTFVQPDSSTQSASTYPRIGDAAISALTRIGGNFAPHAQNAPDMTVALDPGHLMNGQVLVEQASQSTAAITAPTTNPRIDRIVIDNATGAVSVITGTEAASPTAPAIPAGHSPVAQVLLQTTTTAVSNSMLIDERDFSNVGFSSGGLINVQTFTSSNTYTPTAGTTKVIVEVIGGGGSGGGSAATGANQATAASGGGAGAYAKALITSGFSGVTVTVGAGGAAGSTGGSNGNPGSASSFGSLVSAPGGTAGIGGAAFTPPAVVGTGGVSAVSTGGNLINSKGAGGGKGFALTTNAVVAGDGGASVFGGGAQGAGLSAGTAGVSPGSGGSGSPAIANTAARAGGAGANGLVIIYEYA